MQRINVSLDDKTYNILRAISFQKKKPMSVIVRESLEKTLQSSQKKAQLILEADDEEELLDIIANDEYGSWEDLKKKHNFK